MSVPLRMPSPAVVGLVPIRMDEANALLGEWGHYLGPVNRPFRSEAWALDLYDEPIAVAVGASAVSDTVAGYMRLEVVELARLAARDRWATRVMLRLWREVCAPQYRFGPDAEAPRAAIAYSQNARHEGNTYRFDGWTMVTDTAGSSGGGAWSRKRYADDAAYGKKRLWVWRYDKRRDPMGRARRVSRGERTQSDVPLEHEGTGEPMEGLSLAEGEVGVITEAGTAHKVCKSCEANENDGEIVVAPSGLAHLSADGGATTLCGRDASGWSS